LPDPAYPARMSPRNVCRRSPTSMPRNAAAHSKRRSVETCRPSPATGTVASGVEQAQQPRRSRRVRDGRAPMHQLWPARNCRRDPTPPGFTARIKAIAVHASRPLHLHHSRHRICWRPGVATLPPPQPHAGGLGGGPVVSRPISPIQTRACQREYMPSGTSGTGGRSARCGSPQASGRGR